MSTTSPDISARWDADTALPEPRHDRRISLLYRFEYRFVVTMMAILRRWPVEKAARRMGALMRTAGPLIRPTQKRGHANLRLIYPDMTDAERTAILADIWDNLGRTVGEFAHLAELPARVKIVNPERLDPYRHGKSRAIFFSGHFANWEVMPALLHAEGIRYGFVYRAANNPLVDSRIIEMRAEAMSRRQIPKGRRGSRDLVRIINEDLSICMLTDQKLNDGIPSTLLGYPAMTAPTACRLALRENLPLIPIQLERRPNSYFTATIHEPLSIERTGDLKEDTDALTQAMNDVIGDFILHRPDQWLWLHRRWPKKIAG